MALFLCGRTDKTFAGPRYVKGADEGISLHL